MATILLSAAGAAIGGSIGGTVAGLSSVAIGRAVGATLGRVVDQRLLGQGGDAVEVGKVDRFRVSSAGEGDPIAQVFGRMRMPGHVIWASDFLEAVSVTGGGKGAPRKPQTTEYSYTVSLAIGICEGEITSIGRVWADGEEVAPDDLNMRFYPGSDEQQPDPVIEAIEGAGMVPAYRGTAYVVMEDLPLGPYGNRVPQFTFEVIRPEQPGMPDWEHTPSFGIKGAALIPGTGEYSLATTPVYLGGQGEARKAANIATPAGKTDFDVSLEAMTEELPRLEAASLVVSWFGDDLRCADCTIRPKVEQQEVDAPNMPWSVSGLNRATAPKIVQDGGRPIYGGTPTDASVIEAIVALKATGKAVLYYPFILMDPFEGNTLPDPYSDAEFQPSLPWRGRITLSEAPGRPQSPDGTAVADNEVASFFGSASAADFTISDGVVSYNGPEDWRFSRFILHQAALCAAAGGVEAFCIGSEMRGLTQIRGASGFPAVARLRQLAAEVRSLLGAECKISYAADWSEYFGYQPQDGTGDRYFHLDPLWADENIDFIGIDNYMPLSDWRDGKDHLDAQDWDAIYDLDYLQSNIEGGEGYDWYYHSQEARAAQIRTPITDDAHNEPWIYRYKDLKSWWSEAHHERIGGVRQAVATDWEPGSKPIWFTEYGCAAIDKGTNQPNKFLDLRSSESTLPYHSNGARDGLIQMQYLRAMSQYWADPENNPQSELYDGVMLDMTRAYVWTWDVRPYPFFPNNRTLWSDGESYARGHWINGRTSSRTLASVVREVCLRAGLSHFSTKGLYGYVRGFAIDQVTDARAVLQPLMIRYGFDAIERDGELQFRLRDGRAPTLIDPATLAVSEDLQGLAEQSREAEAELSGRVRLRFVQADADFEVIAEEAVLPDDTTHSVSGSELNMTLTRGEGRQVAERWLTEARVSRDTIRLALPPSQLTLGAGDVIEIAPEQGERAGIYRVDRVEQTEFQLLEAVRIDPSVYDPADIFEEIMQLKPFAPPLPVTPYFLDLPLLRGDEVEHAPRLAVGGDPWPGSAATYQSLQDAGYGLHQITTKRTTLGKTQTALTRARAGVVDRGSLLEVKLLNGTLQSVTHDALLAGANLAAIGDGSSDNWEVFQFASAELVAENTYLLGDRLRGQAGTDALMPQAWPAGSVFVLLDGTAEQIDMSPALRRIVQHFRIGPAQRGYDDPSYVHKIEAFDGNGARPLSPVHLKAVQATDGAFDFGWIRRTRVSADSWDLPEVPLAEELESYRVRIMQGTSILREDFVLQPHYVYSAAQQTDDGLAGGFTLEVAQISASYGAGLAGRLQVAT